MTEIWYHGGPQERLSFTDQRWDRDRTTSSLNEEGPGIYWTSSFEQAAGYGPYVVQLELPSNFRLMPQKKPTLSALREIYEQASPEDQETFLSNWGEDASVREVLRKYAGQRTLHDALVTLYGDLFRYDSGAWITAVRGLGYDGIVLPKSYGVEHLIVWAPERISGRVQPADLPPEENPRALKERLLRQ